MAKTFEEHYDLNSVILCNHSLVHSVTGYCHLPFLWVLSSLFIKTFLGDDDIANVIANWICSIGITLIKYSHAEARLQGSQIKYNSLAVVE